MTHFSVWISALRLRTLPLAAASIIVSAGIAVNTAVFDLSIFSLSLITALFLQILSNLANDYGDAISGADNEDRVGPVRSMQTGLISAKSMKKAIILTALLSFFSGLLLLTISLGNDLVSWVILFSLGLLAIFAAITYTMGKLPYGYRAMGDLAVFLFFGLAGVLGSYYLYDLTFDWAILLPACSLGLLSAAVLNINNTRDMETDQASNKITLVVLFGREFAFKYHLFLVVVAPLLSGLYFYQLADSQTWQYVFLLALSPFTKISVALFDAKKADKTKEERADIYNQQLKNMAISTFVFSLLFALVLIPQ
jgi:1,4-dihydroxy-2-naphthoate octaprenyltransferase